MGAVPAFLRAGRADGRTAASAPAAPPGPPPPAVEGPLNPLLSAAGRLLDLAAHLRDRESQEDPDGVRRLALAEFRRFESACATAGVSPEGVRVARFALAALLDDVVRATPWGAAAGAWTREGTREGMQDGPVAPADRFFELLDTMLGDPRLHLQELELFYVCLSLGFEGKYRDRPRGAHELAHLRDALFRVLRRARGEHGRELSPSWRGLAGRDPAGRFRPPAPVAPPWAAWAGAAVVLILLYGSLAGSLARQAEPVAGRLAALLPEQPIEIARVAPPPPPTAGPALIARVSSLLGPELRTRAVEVLAGEDGALVIRIPAAAMFATGSDAIKARHRAIVDRVAQALGPEGGHVVVVGHTDDQTPRTGRLSTAQALTEARAEAVRKLLERYLGASRVTSEGHGDSEPIAPNDSQAGRDANRRIDVRLYP
ncbi:flagellar motor protein MotB [Azospirillum thermophilum]|uniref:Flagellar motor protein MotB n=2 Tax=Azospirillum thermophilum TaxID=2202148 RepID=A0A2S2CN27_9PROT|nr:flagellar motor protein MotB [Azospirillum thermophilum]